MNKNCKCVDKLCKKITHVIFDLDGTLVDSERVYERAFATIAERYGKTFTKEIRVKVLGTVEYRSCQTVVQECELPITTEECIEQFQAESHKYLPDVDLMPGVVRLVTHFHENNIPIAIATSSGKPAYDLKSNRHMEIFNKFHHVVTAGTDPEVKNGKPAPDIFFVCASRFPDKPKPQNILVFEDAPNGLNAALAAGMHPIIIPDPTTDPDKYKHAPVVLKSMEDFQPELYRFPPFK